jgi:hypothetical protein
MEAMRFRRRRLAVWTFAAVLVFGAGPPSGRAGEEAPPGADGAASPQGPRAALGAPAPTPSRTNAAASASCRSPGRGTKADPIVLVQELASASPVTLVIRAVGPVRALRT